LCGLSDRSIKQRWIGPLFADFVRKAILQS
jgi:hypothetical protein